MKRRLLTLALLALAAVPAVGQEVVGFLEPPVVPSSTPDGLAPLHGVIRVFGWVVVENETVRRVTIQVDGVDVGEAFYHRPRSLVTDHLETNFPGSFFPDAEGPGFSFFLNGTDFSNSEHEITAKVLTFEGTEQVLYGVQDNGTVLQDGVHDLFWTFNTNTLPPFGEINSPQRNAELFGNCCMRDDTGACCSLDPNTGFCESSLYDGITASPYAVVDGWALDLGKEIGDSGIGYVELLINGAIIGNSRKTCTFSVATGGLTDCYGLQRLDIERNFPFAVDAPTAGYRFAFDVGRLVRFGFPQGSNTLTIRSGDIGNNAVNIHEIPVNFLCLNNNDNLQSFGRIESPRRNRPYSDLMTFQGWAVDIDGVNRVEIFVDGQSLGLAAFGDQGSRPGVLATFPGYPDAAEPVWRLSDFDTTNLSEGNHQVQVEITDDRGATTTIGEVDFTVNNQID